MTLQDAERADARLVELGYDRELVEFRRLMLHMGAIKAREPFTDSDLTDMHRVAQKAGDVFDRLTTRLRRAT